VNRSLLARGYTVLGVAVVVAWVVSLTVHAVICAPAQALAYGAIGAMPTPLPSLPPLRIPGRDPFASDAVIVPDTQLARPLKHAAAPALNVASMTVPDTGAFGGAGPPAGGSSSLGVLGVIVGDPSTSRAIIEDGAQVDVLRIGDPVETTRIVAISVTGVQLADGRYLPVDKPRRMAPMLPTATAPGALPGAPALVAPRAGFPPGAPFGLPVLPFTAGTPAPAVVATPSLSSPAGLGTSGVGQPYLTQPNGLPVPPSANAPVLFPNVFSTMTPGGQTP
jgi:hypothetical protein